VTWGKPYQEIIRCAGDQQADIIVLSTHGYTGIKRAYLGSTAERVVRHASCPVLIARVSSGQKAIAYSGFGKD
jgi:universal stress protein A